jgi:hypothetical protein
MQEKRRWRFEAEVKATCNEIQRYRGQWEHWREQLLKHTPEIDDSIDAFDHSLVEECKTSWHFYESKTKILQDEAYAQLRDLRAATSLVTRDIYTETDHVNLSKKAIGALRRFLHVNPLPCLSDHAQMVQNVTTLDLVLKQWKAWDHRLKKLQAKHLAQGEHFPHQIRSLQDTAARIGDAPHKILNRLSQATRLLGTAKVPLFTRAELQRIYSDRTELGTERRTYTGIRDLLQSFAEQKKLIIRQLNLLTNAITELEEEVNAHDTEQGQILINKALNKAGLPTIRMQPLVEIFILKPPPSIDPEDIKSNAEAQSMYITRFVHGRLGNAPPFQRAYHWANPFTPGLSGLIYGWHLPHLCACATLIASTHVRAGLRVLLRASSKCLAKRATLAIYEQLADVNIQQLAIGLGVQPELSDLKRLGAAYLIQVGNEKNKSAAVDVEILLLPRTRELSPSRTRAAKTFILLYDPLGSDRADDAFRVQYALQEVLEDDVRNVEQPLTERHGDIQAMLRDSSRIALSALVKGRAFRLPDEELPEVVVHPHTIPLNQASQRAYYDAYAQGSAAPMALLRCILDPVRAKGNKLEDDKSIGKLSMALLTLVHTIVDQERRTPEGGIQLVYTGTDYAKGDADFSLEVAKLVVRTLKRGFHYRDLKGSTQENDAVSLCRNGQEWEKLRPHMGTEVRIIVVPRFEDDGFVVEKYAVSTLHTIFPILKHYELKRIHYCFRPSKQHIAFNHASPHNKQPLGWEIVAALQKSLVAAEEVREYVQHAAVNATFLRTERLRAS